MATMVLNLLWILIMAPVLNMLLSKKYSVSGVWSIKNHSKLWLKVKFSAYTGVNTKLPPNHQINILWVGGCTTAKEFKFKVIYCAHCSAPTVHKVIKSRWEVHFCQISERRVDRCCVFTLPCFALYPRLIGYFKYLCYRVIVLQLWNFTVMALI